MKLMFTPRVFLIFLSIVVLLVYLIGLDKAVHLVNLNLFPADPTYIESNILNTPFAAKAVWMIVLVALLFLYVLYRHDTKYKCEKSKITKDFIAFKEAVILSELKGQIKNALTKRSKFEIPMSPELQHSFLTDMELSSVYDCYPPADNVEVEIPFLVLGSSSISHSQSLEDIVRSGPLSPLNLSADELLKQGLPAEAWYGFFRLKGCKMNWSQPSIRKHDYQIYYDQQFSFAVKANAFQRRCINFRANLRLRNPLSSSLGAFYTGYLVSFAAIVCILSLANLNFSTFGEDALHIMQSLNHILNR